MRVSSRCVAVALLVGGGTALLIAGAVPARAQCAMGMGGGHDHGATQGNRVAKPSGSEKKMRQSIDRLLSDERGRALLTDALLNDRAFMEALVRRLAAIPEWRTMASRQLSAPAPSGADGNDSRVVPGGTSVIYSCTMHPDVTTSSPGDCPKCGMALVRRESRRE